MMTFQPAQQPPAASLRSRIIGVVGGHLPERITSALIAGEFGALSLGWFLPDAAPRPHGAKASWEPAPPADSSQLMAALFNLKLALTRARPAAEVASFDRVLELPSRWESFGISFAGILAGIAGVLHSMEAQCCLAIESGGTPSWLSDEMHLRRLEYLLPAKYAAKAKPAGDAPDSKRRRKQAASTSQPGAPAERQRCNHFQRGTCSRGSSCKYEHSKEPARLA